MIYIKRTRCPESLKATDKVYQCEVSKYLENGGDESSVYRLFFKPNKNKYQYGDAKTASALYLMGKKRCPFCCRKIYDNKSYDTEKKQYLGFTIEHIIPEMEEPRKITKWRNLLPCCVECNGKRGSKPFDKYYDPSKRLFSLNAIKYNYSGEAIPIKTVANTTINLYKLNRTNLVTERLKFRSQLFNDYFEDMIKLEGKNPFDSEGVTFVDMYLQDKKARKERKRLRCKVHLE